MFLFSIIRYLGFTFLMNMLFQHLHPCFLLVLLIISLLLMSLATTGLTYLPETKKLETNAPALHGTRRDETVELFLWWGSTKARTRSQPFGPANIFVHYHRRRALPWPQPSVLGFRPRIDDRRRFSNGPLISVQSAHWHYCIHK